LTAKYDILNEPVDNKKILVASAQILIAFSVLCFITSLFLNSSSSKEKYLSIPATGGEVAINIEKESTIYDMEIKQSLLTNTWSYVYVTVEDSGRTELFSFGSELWSASGYDGGSWSESDTDYSNKVTFDKPGKYFLVVEPELSPGDEHTFGPVVVVLKSVRASYIPHFAVGIFSILIALVLFEIANRTFSKLIFG
jgi:hypothetical protein